MRYLRRLPLSDTTREVLDELYAKVVEDHHPKDRVERLWNAKTNSEKRKKAFTEVRDILSQMASGRSRCMYCEDSEGTDIDHFWPKAAYPMGAFLWENYLLTCSGCNSIYKKDWFELENEVPLLIDPTSDDPIHHIIFLVFNGNFEHIDRRGEETIRVLNLNGELSEDESIHPWKRQLPKGRKKVFKDIQRLILEYDKLKIAGLDQEAEEIHKELLCTPFSSMFVWLLEFAKDPMTARTLSTGVPDIVIRHEMWRWL
jgi:uncharacterized protein (TIGR02646 family)